MDLDFSPEQVQLQDSVQRLLRDHYRFEQRRKYVASATGWSAEAWKQYAATGLLSILVPEECGGLGWGARELLPVMQQMGRSLTLEPYFATAVLGVSLLASAGGHCSELLESVSAGEHRLAVAHEEPNSDLSSVRLQAKEAGGRWLLSGRKCAVLHARDADTIIVSARVQEGREGVGLFTIQPGAAGLGRHDYLLIDGRSSSNLVLNQVPADLLIAPSGQTATALARTMAIGTAALVSEAAGAGRAALDYTTDYMKTRKQFGRSLSEFQALRHRAADMLISVETVEAMARLAAVAADAQPSSAAEADLAGAKLLAGRHGRWVCEQAIQLHGAIAMTDEYIAGNFLQRLAVIDTLLGTQDAQLDRLRAEDLFHSPIESA
jgi:pimeloyl-CoA dehydrogenase